MAHSGLGHLIYFNTVREFFPMIAVLYLLPNEMKFISYNFDPYYDYSAANDMNTLSDMGFDNFESSVGSSELKGFFYLLYGNYTIHYQTKKANKELVNEASVSVSLAPKDANKLLVIDVQTGKSEQGNGPYLKTKSSNEVPVPTLFPAQLANRKR